MSLATRLVSRSVSLLAALTIALIVSPAWAAPTVTLTVLNSANSSGNVVLAEGDDVEVEFLVVDPLNETSNKDKIQLVHSATGDLVKDVNRGSLLAGTVGVKAREFGLLEVQYAAKSDGTVWGDAGTLVTVVSDPATIMLLDWIGTLEAALAATDVDLTALAATVSGHTSDIATNAGNIGTNAGGIATNTSVAATNASAIASNAAATSTNTSNIGVNSAGLVTLGGAITTNTSDIATNASGITSTASGLTSLAGIVGSNTGNIATNAGDIGTNATGLTSLAGTVGTNTGNIATNAGDIGTNAGGIATNASGIATNTSAIAALSSTDLPALQSQVGTNTSNIGTNAGDIAGLRIGLSSVSSVANINRGNINVNTGNIGTNGSGIATNASGISTNATAIAALGVVDLGALQTQVNGIAANTVLDLDGILTFDVPSMTAKFDGVNVQITDGSGTTYRGPNQGVEPHFLGNLIIGYNNPTVGRCFPTDFFGVLDGQTCVERGGTWDADFYPGRGPAESIAHSLIVGDGHAYQGVYGSVIFGARNSLGFTTGTTVLGGAGNAAQAPVGSILGGNNNFLSTTANHSTIAGGRDNTVFGFWSTIAGGFDNTVDGDTNAIAGGRGNFMLSGGRFNTITGGLQNHARDASYSVIVGGRDNILGWVDLDLGFATESQVIAGGDDLLRQGSNPAVAGEFLQNNSRQLRNID